MTPLELQQALTAMPSRAAQTLLLRCVDARPAAECAALYGVGLPQWEVLFLEAARALAGQPSPLGDAARAALAPRLAAAFQTHPPGVAPGDDAEVAALLPPLQALTEHRLEVARLLHEAELAAAASPARARENWLRWAAIVAIALASAYVMWRDRDHPPEPRPVTRPSSPR